MRREEPNGYKQKERDRGTSFEVVSERMEENQGNGFSELSFLAHKKHKFRNWFSKTENRKPANERVL